ncbi:MAG: hypothetical protein DMG15_11030 [Acidobacteria bacterium]|nr:MAG: hypothetical protein DMG16_04930 [Acidobacteriota bacterium]PYS13478.1 MAG: hypothetical protein DMG15_11030 [Acidobacteriota bacterium]
MQQKTNHKTNPPRWAVDGIVSFKRGCVQVIQLFQFNLKAFEILPCLRSKILILCLVWLRVS